MLFPGSPPNLTVHVQATQVVMRSVLEQSGLGE